MKALTINQSRNAAIEELSPVCIMSVLCVGRDKLHFGKEKIQKLARCLNYQFDLLNGNYTDIIDQKSALFEDDEINIEFDEQWTETANSTAEMRNRAEKVSKAFGSVTMATVLCDKFNMKAVKVGQMINAFLKTYDKLKADKALLRQVQNEFDDKYNVAYK